METQKIGLQDKEWAWDWVTALFPVLVISYFYYRFAAVGFILLGAAGYVAATVLLHWGRPAPGRVPAALASALLMALFLPSTAPMWVAAPAGCLAGLLGGLPEKLEGKLPLRLPTIIPTLAGVLFTRWVFAGLVGNYVMPAPWATAENPVVSDSLAFLGQPFDPEGFNRLLLGVHGGPLGEGCVPVILLAGLYLLLRRRLRVIAPAAMLATVSFLSLLVWNAPLYGVLVGGTVLTALVLGDRTHTPAPWGEQALTGLVAGGVTVLIRALTPADGSVTAVLLAVLLAPVYPHVCRFLTWCGKGIATLWGNFFQKLKIRVDKSGDSII